MKLSRKKQVTKQIGGLYAVSSFVSDLQRLLN